MNKKKNILLAVERYVQGTHYWDSVAEECVR